MNIIQKRPGFFIFLAFLVITVSPSLVELLFARPHITLTCLAFMVVVGIIIALENS